MKRDPALLRLVTWLERHPVAKLVAIAWVVLSAVGSALVTWHQVGLWRREAQSSGTHRPPRRPAWKISDKDLTCSLVNVDVFPLKEVTIVFARHTVFVNPCYIDSLVGLDADPAASAHTLQPLETLKATVTPEAWMNLSGVAEVFFPDGQCPTTSPGCARLLECRARFHRTDMTAYEDVSDTRIVLQRPLRIVSDTEFPEVMACFRRLRPKSAQSPEGVPP
jgi:hypothetical protein